MRHLAALNLQMILLSARSPGASQVQPLPRPFWAQTLSPVALDQMLLLKSCLLPDLPLGG